MTVTPPGRRPSLGTRPRGPFGLAYARIEVPDLAASVAWYRYHVGLVPVLDDGERAMLRYGTPHHCIELVAAPGRTESWTTAVGFTVDGPEVLADLRARVEAAGHAPEPLADPVKGLCLDGFAVTDPNGLVVELLDGFQEYAEPPDEEMLPRDLVHPFLSTDRFEESYEFYTAVLGFQPSDHIVGSTSFLRSEDRYHHSLALRRDDSFYVAHLCFLMESFDHVMRRRARALYKGVPIPSDLVNHSASGSLAFYMHDPAHGPRIELCDGHIVLDAVRHEIHEPRHMALDPRNIDVWRAAADDWARF